MDLLLIWFVKILLWLRYRVRVRGLTEVLQRGRKGILFLPNHPALIDPIILASQLYGPFGVRALADRDQVDRFFIRWLAKRIGVLAIPDMAKAGSGAAEEIQRVVGECIDALACGDNLILYPAGRTYRSCLEDLGGTSAVQTILRRLPDVRVVLVRTRGLWGSGFSRASGREANVPRVLWKGAKALLLSGIVFAPRREVSVELVEPDDLPRTADRTELNRYLETFYNADPVPNTYVPYSLWERGSTRPMSEPVGARIEGDLGRVGDATRRLVIDYLRGLTASEKVFNDDARLAHDLGLDSLARADLLLWLAKEFGFPPGDVDSVQTVGDVMLAACGEGTAPAARPLKPAPDKWFKQLGQPFRPDGLADMTICQAFLTQAGRQPTAVIMADQTAGVKTYRDVVTGIFALKPAIEALEGDRVGIMLPSTVAANVVYLATLFAGKTPVMVNWTAGRKNVLHSLDTVGVRRILTARALATQLESQGVGLGEVADRYVFLEDIAARLSLRAKLAAALGSRFSWRSLWRANVSPTAVILFTSGSESVPKAVPLSHRNMLTNIHDAWERFTAEREDAIVAILPPFHSFGLTGTMMLSVCLGVRAVYYPKATEGGPLGQIIDAYKATILIGTPTFLHGIVRASRAEQLASLRLVVSGAEKCTPRVYNALMRRCPQTKVLEGYGVTECAPVISANDQRDPKAGTIGRVMPSLEHVLVHPETGERVEPGAKGILLVRGPSVFDGYLDYDGPSPFVEFEGRTWYRTGDLVVEDADGMLTFSGRLKRFVKLGGEMISLPAVEAVLAERFGRETDDGPHLAVTATADEEHPEIVLFTVRDIDRDEANEAIREAGLSALHNIRRAIRVDELPLLGTGKTDYRALEGRLGEGGNL